MPLKLLTGDSDKKKLNEIINIIQEKNAGGIVIGLPINMDGSNSDQTELTEKFAIKLSKRTLLPIFLQDERLTSKAANNLFKDLGFNRKHRNSMDDLAAASMILETTLNRIQNINPNIV
jgi:putative Holliday junction resolvase